MHTAFYGTTCKDVSSLYEYKITFVKIKRYLVYIWPFKIVEIYFCFIHSFRSQASQNSASENPDKILKYGDDGEISVIQGEKQQSSLTPLYVFPYFDFSQWGLCCGADRVSLNSTLFYTQI